MVETLHDKKVLLFFLSDNGREFRTENFDKYLTIYGIQRRLSITETAQHNWKSERLKQTLLTHDLLIELGVDNRFWAQAIATVAYIHNKKSSSAINANIPEKIWSNSESKTDYLKIFGCRTWSHVRAYSRKEEFFSKAKECILVGYTSRTEEYSLYDMEKKKQFFVRNVIFFWKDFSTKNWQLS